MARAAMTLRPAVPSDVDAILPLWTDVLRRASAEEQAADLRLLIERAAQHPDACLLVADFDGAVAGAVFLRATTVSAINLEPMVQALSPHVHPEFRRRGVGTALMEAAAAFAEERGIGYVGSAATSHSRDSNRFFARMAMGPRATLRVAPTHTLRQRLAAMRPARGLTGPGSRQVDKVLAMRRVRRDRLAN